MDVFVVAQVAVHIARVAVRDEAIIILLASGDVFAGEDLTTS